MKAALIAAVIISFATCNVAYAQSAVPPTKNLQVAQTQPGGTQQGGTPGGQSKGTTGATTGAAAGGTLSTPMIVGLAVAAGVVAVAAGSKSTTSH
jgi:hypothetical protein